jgi:hypothetical protein
MFIPEMLIFLLLSSKLLMIGRDVETGRNSFFHRLLETSSMCDEVFVHCCTATYCLKFTLEIKGSNLSGNLQDFDVVELRY